MRGLLLLPLFVSSLLGQALWTAEASLPRPGARWEHGLAYDAVSQQVLLFGGSANAAGAALNDVWQWNGVSWTNVTYPVGVTHPAGVIAFGFCPDPSGGVLMFGGFSPGAGLFPPILHNWTWRLDGAGAWTPLNVGTSPSPRRGLAMTPTNQGVLLFGGGDANMTNLYGDTWLWNGTSWSQLAPATSPPARARHCLAYDPNRNVAVLFGGTGLTDTWEFDGVDWQQRFPAHQPPGGDGASMAFHPSGVIALFGGSFAANDTWTWDGSDWQQLTSSNAPTAREGTRVAYDAARDQILMIGGVTNFAVVGDGATLGIYPSAYSPFGSGCADPFGQVPTLTALANELPRLGTTSHLRTANLPAALTVPVFVLGLSNTVQPGSPSYPLPFDLGLIGWVGCQQLISLDIFNPMISFGSQSDFAFAVPYDLSWLGLQFYCQTVVLYDPSGIAVTNALAGVVGI